MQDLPVVWDDMVLVGRMARTHGLRGHVVVAAETDFPEVRFAPGAGCWTLLETGPALLVVATARMQNGRPLVSFEGYDTIDAVEPLIGRELRVREDDLLPLPAGSYYHHQLAGCAVETASGATVGRVTRVQEGAGGSLLVVDGGAGEVLVPFVKDICIAVDVEGRRIVVNPPEGLIDLNTPGERTRRRHGGARRAAEAPDGSARGANRS